MKTHTLRVRPVRAVIMSLLWPCFMLSGPVAAEESATEAVEFADADGDGLPDEWEIKHFGDLSQGPDDDPDGDTLGNLFEYEIGTNPTLADTDGDGRPDWVGIPGYLYQEIWSEREPGQPHDHYPRHRFDAPGAEVFYHPGAECRRKSEPDFRQRLRGRIVAPATGEYTFWISSNNWCELWLGENESRFSARLLAGLADGRHATRPRQFDRHPSQQSAPVRLVAGREYHLEILHRHRKSVDHHVVVAWTPPGGDKPEILPPSVIRSWVPEAVDSDDDGIRDDWKTARNLPRGRRIALEDPDGDGVPVALEYRAGADPHDGSPVPGLLAWSRWYNPPDATGSHFEIGGFPFSPQGMRRPDYRGAAPAAGARLPIIASSLVPTIDRLHGTVTVPESGLYTFHILGRTSAQLSISPDARPTGLRSVARRTRNTTNSAWIDGVATERSIPLWLEKGEPHFIEMLHAPGEKLRLAWRLHQPRQWSESTLGGGVTGGWTEAGPAGIIARVHGQATFGGAAGDGLTFRHSTAPAATEIVARLNSLRTLPADAGGGLMLRASDDPFAPFVALTLGGDRRFGLHHREEDAGREFSHISRPYPGTSFRLEDSVWLRLRSDGRHCTAYYSSDTASGIRWRKIGTVPVGFGESLLGGPVAWGGRGDEPAEIPFTHLALDPHGPEGEVPAGIFATPGTDPLDLDGDGLPDAWEIEHGLDPADSYGENGPHGDPDGDGFTNLEEYHLGGHPLESGGFPGHLTLEYWGGIPGSTVADLTGSPKFLGEPDRRELVSRPDLQGGDGGTNYGQRLRGTITAPVTGSYRFWIAGDNGCSLALSTGPGRAGLREIAALAGSGGQSTGVHEWDKFPSQRSEEIQLEGGAEYHIEILHKEGRGADHVAVAWAYTDEFGRSQPREILPSKVLKSHVPDKGDLDDDGLPDEWEIDHGLNPEDNGRHDPVREGAAGDFDGDGLTNMEEYLLGTDPSKPDTDGDGVSDFDELRLFGTNPLKGDAVPPELLVDVRLNTYDGQGSGLVIDHQTGEILQEAREATASRWALDANGNLTSLERRGDLEYTFQIGRAGIHKIDLKSHSIGNGAAPVPLTILVDGIQVGTGEAMPGMPRNGLSWLTPWLEEGEHTVTIRNHNVRGDVTLVIEALEILILAGEDSDSNGLPDWFEPALTERNRVTRPKIDSMTSPACIEGVARFLVDLDVAADGVAMEIGEGPGQSWFCDVPLAEGRDTAVVATFEAGAIAEAYNLRWIETNLLDFADEPLSVRQGDALRLSAWRVSERKGSTTFRISLDGQPLHEGMASQAFIHRFLENGTSELHVEVLEHGTAVAESRIEVRVVGVDLGPDFHVPSNDLRVWTPPAFDEEVFLEADPALTIRRHEGSEGSASFDVGFSQYRSARGVAVARLGDEGPVMDSVVFHGFFFAPSTWTRQNQQIRTLADGTRVYSVAYIIDGVIPEDLSIWLMMHIAGVMFENGDSWYELTAADFDENGKAELIFLKSPNSPESYICHAISQYGDSPAAEPDDSNSNGQTEPDPEAATLEEP